MSRFRWPVGHELVGRGGSVKAGCRETLMAHTNRGGLWGKAPCRPERRQAAMERANHIRPARGDPRHKGVISLRFRRDLGRPIPARRTRVRLAARGPTDEHRPRA